VGPADALDRGWKNGDQGAGIRVTTSDTAGTVIACADLQRLLELNPDGMARRVPAVKAGRRDVHEMPYKAVIGPGAYTIAQRQLPAARLALRRVSGRGSRTRSVHVVNASGVLVLVNGEPEVCNAVESVWRSRRKLPSVDRMLPGRKKVVSKFYDYHWK